MFSRLTTSLKKDRIPSGPTSITRKRYSLASNQILTPNFSRIRFKSCNYADKTVSFSYYENGSSKTKTITLDENTKLFLYINNLEFKVEFDINTTEHILIYFYAIHNVLNKDNQKLQISRTCIVDLDGFNYNNAKIDNSGKLIYGDTSSDKPEYLPIFVFYEEKPRVSAYDRKVCDGNIAIAIYLPWQEKPLLLIANHKKYLNRIFFDKNRTRNKYYNNNNITLNELLELPNVALIMRHGRDNPDEIIKDFDDKGSDYAFENNYGKLNIVHKISDEDEKPVPIGDFLSSTAHNTAKPLRTTGSPKTTITDYLSYMKKQSDVRYTPIVNPEQNRPQSIALNFMSGEAIQPEKRKTQKPTEKSKRLPITLNSIIVGNQTAEPSVGARNTMNTVGARNTMNTVGARNTMNTVGARNTMNTVGARNTMNTVGARNTMNTVGARNTMNTVGARNTVGTRSGKNTRKRISLREKPTRPAPPVPSKTKNRN